MESQKSPYENQHPSAAGNPAITSCRKKKSEDATYLQDLRDHVDEFIHASMDEHKTCFKKTIQKVSGNENTYFYIPISSSTILFVCLFWEKGK